MSALASAAAPASRPDRAAAPVPPPDPGPEPLETAPPEPGAELFHGWTLRARVIGDRVVAKATCPTDGRVLSSGPQPTRAHAFTALREQVTAALDCEPPPA